MQTQQHHNSPSGSDSLVISAIRVSVLLLFCWVLASIWPPDVFPALMQALLGWMAFAIAMRAWMLSEKISTRRFGRWDEAAFLLAMSALAGLFDRADAALLGANALGQAPA